MLGDKRANSGARILCAGDRFIKANYSDVLEVRAKLGYGFLKMKPDTEAPAKCGDSGI